MSTLYKTSPTKERQKKTQLQKRRKCYNTWVNKIKSSINSFNDLQVLKIREVVIRFSKSNTVGMTCHTNESVQLLETSNE